MTITDQMTTAGKLISIEGGEGAGKSTVIAAILDTLAAHGIRSVQTREPGGTALGEALRELLLAPKQPDDSAHPEPCAEAELLMMFASRAQLVRELVLPTLASGDWLVTDRFTDASYAYQGGGRGQPAERIAELESWAAGIRPDLTLLLDLPIDVGLERVRGRGPSDRIEVESNAFFERVRASYRQRAADEPQRFVIIDASQPLDEVVQQVRTTIDDFIARVAST